MKLRLNCEVLKVCFLIPDRQFQEALPQFEAESPARGKLWFNLSLGIDHISGHYEIHIICLYIYIYIYTVIYGCIDVTKNLDEFKKKQHGFPRAKRQNTHLFLDFTLSRDGFCCHQRSSSFMNIEPREIRWISHSFRQVVTHGTCEKDSTPLLLQGFLKGSDSKWTTKRSVCIWHMIYT